MTEAELVCAECGLPESQAPGPMRAFHGRDGYADDEAPEVVILCDECARREGVVDG